MDSLASPPARATPRPSRAATWLLAALVAGTLLICLPYQALRPRRVEVGTEAAAEALRGFSFPELAADGQAFRWSDAAGAVRFSNVANRPLAVRLRLHALRPAREPAVSVTVNGREVGSLTAGGAFAEHELIASRAAVGWDGDVTVGIRVQPFTAPPDTRQLGAAVAWIEIAPAGGPAVPPWPALARVLLPALLAEMAVFWLARRLRRSLPVAAALGVSLAALAALWVRCDEAGALRWAWLVSVLLWLVAVAIAWGPWAARRIMARLCELRARHPVGFWLTVIVLLALAIYLPLSLTRGYEGDITIYMAWTHQVTHFGIHSAYAPDAASRPNTTPGLLYPFRVIGEVFRRFFSPDFPQPWIDSANQASLRFMLRLPALICNGLIAAAAFWLVRRRWGARMALIAVATYVFNPAVIFESAYYGQTGAVHALFMLLGVIGLAEGAPAAAWASLAAGMLTKPQADLFLPLFIVLTWRRYGWRALLRSALAALAVALLMLSPFIVHGTLGQMWERVSHPADYHPMLSATAHNVWWLFSLGNGKASDLLMPPLLDQLARPIFTYRSIGLGLVGLAYLLVLVRTWRDRSARALYLSAAYLFTAFFMLATQIHENHLIPMFSLLLIACCYPAKGCGDAEIAERTERPLRPLRLCGESRLWMLYAVFAVMATLNMALHYPQILRVLVPQNPDVWGGAEMALPRWLSSLAQVSVFAYWTVAFVRETLSRLPIRKTQ